MMMLNALTFLRYVKDINLGEIIFSLGLSAGLLFFVQQLMVRCATQTVYMEQRREMDPDPRYQPRIPRIEELELEILDEGISEPILGDGDLPPLLPEIPLTQVNRRIYARKRSRRTRRKDDRNKKKLRRCGSDLEMYVHRSRSPRIKSAANPEIKIS